MEILHGLIGILYFKMLLFLRQRKSMKLKLPNWGSLCNPNLLLNSDFRNGIINQQGKTSYLKGSNDWGKIYSIDMWAIQKGIQLSVNSNIISVECTNSNEPGYLLQKLDYVGKATAAINIKSITGSVSLNTAYGKYELLKKGLNIITYDFGFEQSDSWFSIRISEGSTVEIDFMKLEPGEHFTGMPIYNRAIELLKCQKKYVMLKDIKWTLKGHTSQTFSLSLLLPVDMEKTPSVTVVNTDSSFGIEDITAWSNGQVIQIAFKCLTDNMFDARINRVEVDAYDY